MVFDIRLMFMQTMGLTTTPNHRNLEIRIGKDAFGSSFRGLMAPTLTEFKFYIGALGALIIRIGFWGPLYYNYSKEPPK